MDKRVLSNRRVTVWIGPDTAIANYKAPKKSEIDTLLNVSEAQRWDGFDFNLEGSDQQDDRVLTDEAGAQSRSFDQWGGSMSFQTPKPEDKTSIVRQVRELLKNPRTPVAVVIRTVVLNSVGATVGDEVNAYRCIADAQRHGRQDTGYSYTVNFVPKDDVGINAIIPSATPTAVTLTAVGSTSGAVGSVGYVRATYEGKNVTIGATYISSAPNIVDVTPHGAYVRKALGTANISATYPGSAAPGAGTAITVA
jgi:hypothetical protein